MEAFTRLVGRAAALPAANIDTDIIMPKIFLKGIDRTGLAQGLFYDLRFDGRGMPRPEFVLNRPETTNPRFLLTGRNFGCGSSREHAVWGMLQYGIRAILGSSFAGIFADNAANNGLLLITLPLSEIARLMTLMDQKPVEFSVDLVTQRIDANGLSIPFDIEAPRRRMLMEGLDRIGETLTRVEAIRSFQETYLSANPWLV